METYRSTALFLHTLESQDNDYFLTSFAFLSEFPIRDGSWNVYAPLNMAQGDLDPAGPLAAGAAQWTAPNSL